jgi:predicted transcriptional regulator
MNPDSNGGIHTDQEYIEATQENQPASTKEVARAVGVTRQAADYRLRKLEEEGRVKSKKIGGSLAWSPSLDEEHEHP